MIFSKNRKLPIASEANSINKGRKKGGRKAFKII
jgi:hypothetical protein